MPSVTIHSRLAGFDPSRNCWKSECTGGLLKRVAGCRLRFASFLGVEGSSKHVALRIQKAKALQARYLAYQRKCDAASELALEARHELESELESQTVRQADASLADCMFLLAFALEASCCFDEAKRTVEKAFLLPGDQTLGHLQVVLAVVERGINIGKWEDAAALAKEARKRKVEHWGMSTSSNEFLQQHFRLLGYYSS